MQCSAVHAVFGTPLILPGQFLDSPELPSEQFLEQFSRTLSDAQHPSTRHNTAAALRPPRKLPDALARALTAFIWRDGHVPPLQPLYGGPYAVLRHSQHHFTLQIGDKEDKVSTLRLKPCNDPTALPAQPRASDCPLLVCFRDFPPPFITAARRVHFAPSQGQEPGTISPWPATRGFCTPHRRSNASSCPASTQLLNTGQTRSLDLLTTGLEIYWEPCRGYKCSILRWKS
jgi:hypothetical protein